VIAPIICSHTLFAAHAKANRVVCTRSHLGRLRDIDKSAWCTGSAAPVFDKHTKTSQLTGLFLAGDANTDIGRFVLVTRYLPLAIKNEGGLRTLYPSGEGRG
jgi:hypothetical protein